MGHYVRKKQGRQRSLSEALSEAEDEHYLDCPDADLITRSAALLLDAMLLFLVVTAMDRVSRAMGILFVQRSSSEQMELTLRVVSLAVKIMVYYVIDIWAVFRWGGSFAKILLGLRVIDRETGGRLTFSQTLVREVFGKILLGVGTLGIGWAVAAFRADRLALQDLVSRSVVKKVRQAT